MTGLEILASAAALLVGFGLLETTRHRRYLRRIPTRIHVSGTRGKSSVTRLIAAGLRGADIRSAAKTTGTLARMILPDGRELPVFRPAGANVIEQVRIVAAAAELGAEALVLECMALQPWLHWVSENKLVRATHGVITNARPDHLDIMGPTDADVARCLSGMIPLGGRVYTAEREHIEIIAAAAADRGSEVSELTDADLAAVTDEQMAGFRYLEHRENVALALKVVNDLGAERAAALAGMQAAEPDPGALTEHIVDFFGRRLIFVNAFAANDPQSTATVWNIVHQRHQQRDRLIAVFNLRADRPSRTIQLASASYWRQADRVVLMGSGAYLFARMAARTGFDPGRLVYAEHSRVEDIFETIVEQSGRTSLIIGMANIGGQGLALARHFSNRAMPASENHRKWSC